MNDNYILKLTDIRKSYPSQEGGPSTDILKKINLQVNKGEAIAIMGPSGSGKSTLLNIIGTLDHPSSGKVDFNGRELSNISDNESASLRNKELGFIFQLHHLLPQYTVLENVLIPAFAQSPAPDTTERAHKLLNRVGLANRLLNRPGQLSGGECQRVALVRALINRPSLILADEPTGSLDQTNALTMTDLLINLNREENTTLIVVTHSEELAGKMSRRLSLVDGVLTEYE